MISLNQYTNISRYGNSIRVRAKDSDGVAVHYEETYSPSLFLAAKPGEKTPYKNMYGEPLRKKKFGTMRKAKEFLDQYKGLDNLKVYGMERFEYQYLSDYYDGVDFDWDHSYITTVVFDLECACDNGFPEPDDADEEILCGTFHINGMYHVFGTKPFEQALLENELLRKLNCTYTLCNTEHELLEKILDFWIKTDMDVITGWNIKFFDIPYLYNRMCKVLGEKKAKNLSPFGYVGKRTVNYMNQDRNTYTISGISTLDYIELYQKFTYNKRESYRLDYIAYIELGRKKLGYEEFDNIHMFYKNDWNKFVGYNMGDVELVVALDEKLAFLSLCYTVAYDALVNFEDVFSQLRCWDAIIYNHLKAKNVVIPIMEKADKATKFEGAYVKDPITGLHDWVVSYDVNSLYPSLMIFLNISPEKVIDGVHVPNSVESFLKKEYTDQDNLIENDWSLGANGICFNREGQGFLPEIIVKMYADRKAYKKKMIEASIKLEDLKKNPRKNKKAIEEWSTKKKQYDAIQKAKKIALNSCYGSLGNQYGRYYDIRMAEAITLTGQLAIRWVANDLNKFLNGVIGTKDEDFVLAIDTDSNYLKLDKLVKKFWADKSKKEIVDILDKACEEKIQPVIDRSFNQIANYLNATVPSALKMSRECIADRGFWTAKKRYALNVWNSEGVAYKKPKIKIMGIETTRSSTPQFFRDALERAIKIILNKDNKKLIKYVEKIESKFRRKPVEDIAFPRGCNNLEKWSDPTTIYTKGTPIQVKGALLWNHWLDQNPKLKNQYQHIQSGEKLKYVYLKEPNILKDKVIAFPNSLPQEFGLHSAIDYDIMFDKAFIQPLKNITSHIGWTHEPVLTLEGFFG